MARSFNNSNQYLFLGTTPVTAVPLTISCWFYPAATNDTYDAMFIKNAGDDNYFGIYLNPTGASAVVGAVGAFGGAEAIATTSTTFSASTWNHAAAVFTSASSRAAFLNGGGKGTDGTTGTPSGLLEINIGGYEAGPLFGPMNGRLAEIAIWNAALTDDEVLSLSKGVSPLRVHPQNLVAYWPLYGNGSPEPNYVRNSTDLALTLINAPPQIDHAPVMAPWSGARILRYVPAAAGAVTGTLATTEASDVAAFPSGTVAWNAALAATESADTASIAGLVGRSGTLAVTEAADVANLAGLVGRSGTLAASESANLSNTVDPTLFEAWWNFASGATDATGHGNDGTLHGTTLTTDPYGRAARSFNGSTDYIDGSSSPLEP